MATSAWAGPRWWCSTGSMPASTPATTWMTKPSLSSWTWRRVSTTCPPSPTAWHRCSASERRGCQGGGGCVVAGEDEVGEEGVGAEGGGDRVGAGAVEGAVED